MIAATGIIAPLLAGKRHFAALSLAKYGKAPKAFAVKYHGKVLQR
jgi:hypothetical protein